MSQLELMQKRTPAQQAKSLLARLSSGDAENYVYDCLSNSRREHEAVYWAKVFQELKAFDPSAGQEDRSAA